MSLLIKQIMRVYTLLASLSFALLALYFVALSLSLEHQGTILVTRDSQVAITLAVLSMASAVFGYSLIGAPQVIIVTRPPTELKTFDGVDKHIAYGYNPTGVTIGNAVKE